MSRKESPHITSLRRQDTLNRLSAAGRMRVADGRVEKYEGDIFANGIEAALEAAREAEARARFATPEIGDIDARGVFLGEWRPTDNDGKSLSQTFNVFAAPEDLPGVRFYEDTVKYIAKLRDWHGHAGASYANERELREALKKGEYDGGWFIPPSELLYGQDAYNIITHFDALSVHWNKGAFKGTYKGDPEEIGNGDCKGWYWSSTELGLIEDTVCIFRMARKLATFSTKDSNPKSCRPVRLELKL